MKHIRVGLSLALVGTLILTLVLTACTGSQAAPNPDEIVLYETTKVFTEEEAENVLEFTEDRDTIVFEEVTAFVADIEPGDVLVSEYPVPGGEYGFLERVIEVSDDGKAVEVEGATLEDVIERGVIVVNQTIPVEDLMADAMWAPGVQVLQIEEGYKFTRKIGLVTIEGHLLVTANAKANLEASWWYGLQSFEFVFSPGFEMGASLVATESFIWEREWPLGTVKWVIPIYGPVALNLGIDLVVGTTGNIKGTLKTSVTYERGYKVGFRYDSEDGWSTINEVTGDGFTLDPPTLHAEIEGLVYGGVRLSATAGVAYVLEGGLGLALLGNVRGSGEVSTPPQWKWEYDFQLYLSAQLSIGLDALLIGDLKHEFAPWRWPDPPYTLAYGASGRVTTADGNGVEGVRIEFSGGYEDTTTNSAGYWCKHLLTKPVAVTPYKDGYTFQPQFTAMDGRGSNYDFVATKKVQYLLVTSSDEGGTVTKPPTEGEHWCDENETVTLQAGCDSNRYEFDFWTSDNPKIDRTDKNPTSIKMDGNYTVTAHFRELDSYCGNCQIETPNQIGQNETCDQLPSIAGGQCPGGQHCINCTCQLLTTRCGDGILSPGEDCDLADKVQVDPDMPCGDSPTPCPGGQECINCNCESPEEICGDGVVSGSEECDPGDPDDLYTYPPIPCPGDQECVNCRCVSPEEVLHVACHTHVDTVYRYNGYQYVCDYCTLTISFSAEDISSGDDYPITNVALIVDGAKVYDSGSISQHSFEDVYVLHEVGCGKITPIEVRAVNSAGLEGISPGSVPCGP